MRALLEVGADPTAGGVNGPLPVDHIKDNEQFEGTEVYWELDEARFRSSAAQERTPDDR